MAVGVVGVMRVVGSVIVIVSWLIIILLFRNSFLPQKLKRLMRSDKLHLTLFS
jgi:hypothetical protein